MPFHRLFYPITKITIMYFNHIDEKRRTAIYVRISTAMQKTDRQVEELVAFAKANRLNFDESTDIYKDIISGFKDGEDRPNFSILMPKLELGEYQQVLFSEFSRLERKPTNLLRDLEKFQSLGVYATRSPIALVVMSGAGPATTSLLL